MSSHDRIEKLNKGNIIKKLIVLVVLVTALSFLPTPPTGQTALADVEKPPSKTQLVAAKSSLTTKKVQTTHVQAPQPVPATEVVQPTTPTPAPVVDTPTYPTDATTIMSEANISPSDYYYVNYIISHEGGWCATRWQNQTHCTGVYDPDFNSLSNPYEGYGLCQSTPGNKMASAGSDYVVNPVTQMDWCNSYASSRYGSWYNAYIHWIDNGNW